MLPFETKGKKAIRAAFANQLGLSREMLGFAQAMIGCKNGRGKLLACNPRTPDVRCYGLAMGLYVKACKQFRAIIAVSELGLVSEGDILLRALFETVLALHFLLKQRLVMKSNGKRLAMPPGRLTTGFRASLYLASAVFESERRFNAFRNTHRLKRWVKKLGDERETQEQVRQAVALIGSEWAEKLRKSKSYAGVSIRDLAESLGVLPYYNSVYAFQCQSSHAKDAIDHVDFEKNGKAQVPALQLALGPKCPEVGQFLELACTVLIGALIVLDQRLRLGFEKEIASFWTKLGNRCRTPGS
jgi:hypothetical protein